MPTRHRLVRIQEELMSLRIRAFVSLLILMIIAACGQRASQPSTARPAAKLPVSRRANAYPTPPPMTIDPNRIYTANIITRKGEIVIALDAKAAPRTVNNFVFLVNQGFYDGLVFHRVEPGSLIQSGDPLGSGRGGPGYTIPAEIGRAHVEGAMGMARLPDAVNRKRDSSGSQFYITLAPAPDLDGQYTVFGQVAAGYTESGKPTEDKLEVVKRIAAGDVISQVVISVR